MRVFAENYRGFKFVEIDTNKVNLLVGDNSCGKSSLIYLVETVLKDDLNDIPRFNDDFSIDDFDYFSPYSDYNDVTFGIKAPIGTRYAKIVTVHRREAKVPELVRCTFFYNNDYVSFRKNGNSIERRNGKVSNYETDNLILLHNGNENFKSVNLQDSVSISEPVAIFSTSSGKSADKDKIIFRAALDNIAYDARVVSPLRALPEKYYTFKRRMNAHGKHFASLWYDFAGSENNPNFKDINKFGMESGLYDSINVKKIANEIEDSPLVVTVKRSGKEFLLNQVGIGVSQVVPVLIDTMYSMHFGNPSLLMQQPELHLHPVAQAALGTYLAECSFKGLRPVIETHSSYLIDRVRAEIRDFEESELKPKHKKFDAEIIFCEKISSGNKATHIPILDDGTLEDAPDSYHEFFVEELVRTMF
ncbi:AAA family ATPase [Sphingomonas sanguinis]|uniref:AAA family ATPase n=1 Tax=Sphingomonas sanguinis TaxID=33051 RepID=UPI000A90BB6E|nr:AAA family ATPase [Sphingomonas sanguinis]